MASKGHIGYDSAGLKELSDREVLILRAIIQLYLLKAVPVGSRYLSKYLQDEISLSPASVRNVMAGLESMELLTHPHTSAGRVPTDKGYRFYVDSMLNIEEFNIGELSDIQKKLTDTSSEDILKEASGILGKISKYLSVVELPHLSGLIVHKIELIELTGSRFLAVLALDSNIVRTLTLEADFEINPGHLKELNTFINDRVSGKRLNYIRENFKEMILDYESRDKPLIRLFVDSIDKLFKINKISERLHISGTRNLLKYPEFEGPEKVKGVVELIENEDMIVHLLDNWDSGKEGLKVLIGSEMQSDILEDYSLIISNYELGSATGSIGLIGPKRMDYSKMISLVSQISGLLNRQAP